MSGKGGAKPKLVIIEGKDKGKIITLQDGTAVIGRSKGDVLIQDARVSRSHVAIHYDSKAGTLSFTDLKSLNGTLINGESGESGELHDGDKLQLGDTLFDIQLSQEEEAAPPPEPAKKKSKKRETEPRNNAETREQPRAERIDRELQAMDENPDEEQEERPRRGRAKSGALGSAAARSAPTSKSLLPKIRHAYTRIPQRTRNLGLAVVAAVMISMLLGRGVPLPGGDVDREVTALLTLDEEGKGEEALAKAEGLKKKFGDDSRLHMTLGQLYTSQRKYEQAIASYQKARTLKPEQPVIPVRLVRLYLRSGLMQEADSEMQVLDQMMKDGQHSRELFVEAAQLFLEFKDLNKSPEKALILSKALQTEYAKDSAIGYKLEAQALFQQNRNEEALHALEKGLQLDPQDDWILENLAFAKLSLKDIAGAGEVVQNWIKVHPNATKALLVMAYLKFNDRNYPEALPFAQKIVQLSAGNQKDPLYPEALNLVGQIQLQMGNMAEAESFMKQACEQGFSQACDNELVRRAAANAAAAQAGQPSPASVPQQQQAPQGAAPAPAQAAPQAPAPAKNAPRAAAPRR